MAFTTNKKIYYYRCLGSDDYRYEGGRVCTWRATAFVDTWIAGAEDPLRLPGYADELAARISDGELLVYQECGHMPNIEHSERFGGDAVSFLGCRYREVRCSSYSEFAA